MLPGCERVEPDAPEDVGQGDQHDGAVDGGHQHAQRGDEQRHPLVVVRAGRRTGLTRSGTFGPSPRWSCSLDRCYYGHGSTRFVRLPSTSIYLDVNVNASSVPGQLRVAYPTGPSYIELYDTTQWTPSPPSRGPRLPPAPSIGAGHSCAAAGLLVDSVAPDRVVGHIDLDHRHHTPWGIVHGGVYATAVESAASIGASAAVAERVGWRWDSPIPPTSSARSPRDGPGRGGPPQPGADPAAWQVDVTDGSGRRSAYGEVRLQNLEPRGD